MPKDKVHQEAVQFGNKFDKSMDREDDEINDDNEPDDKKDLTRTKRDSMSDGHLP